MTIRIEDVALPQHPIALGDFREFSLRGADPDARVDFYLTHNGLRYVRPLNATGAASVRFAIESPGQYLVTAVWRTAAGTTGRTELGFAVAGPSSAGPPQLADLDRRTRVWTASPWEAAVSAGHEAEVVTELCGLIAPGSTVYDIGANVGQFSIPLARRVGPTGRVYCLEASPVCVYFLRANLMLTGLDNFDILPVCLLDESRPCEFTITYGNGLLGLAAGASDVVKPGHTIQVEGRSLDELIETLDLRPPDFIKLDIEGGEVLAIRGMERTLTRIRPSLMLELHGRPAARAVVEQLNGLGYRFKTVGRERTFKSAVELIEWFPDACIQILALNSR